MTKTYSVYFAQVGAYVKVGHSGNVPARLRILTKPDSGLTYPADFDFSAPVVLLRSIASCSRSDEKRWHLKLQQHHAAGEWFVDGPELRAAIAADFAPDAQGHHKWVRSRELSLALRRGWRAS